MSAVTLLPIFPPNWKWDVGNSCTNSNPAKKQKQKEQVKKLEKSGVPRKLVEFTMHGPCLGLPGGVGAE